jgi:trehalose 6-phosphate phosphatase
LKDILGSAPRRLLGELAGSRVLLAFDFDGTLAPIVRDRGEAALTASTARLLRACALRYPCIVVSGRARADIRTRLDKIAVRAIVGNHGAEPWRGSFRLAPRVRRWRSSLEKRLAKLPGVEIEDKVYSITVHYRGARARTAARDAILAAAADLDGARAIVGAEAINILGQGGPHKGWAVERERKRLRCAVTIYAGDDDTDEDVFRFIPPSRLLAIRVGFRRDSAAAYFLKRQPDIDRLLRLLADARPL